MPLANHALSADRASTATALGQVAYVVSGPIVNPSKQQTEGTADCPRGMVVIGGGGQGSDNSTGQEIDTSGPFHGAGIYGWGVEMDNTDTSADHSFRVYAICSKTASASGL